MKATGVLGKVFPFAVLAVTAELCLSCGIKEQSFDLLYDGQAQGFGDQTGINSGSGPTGVPGGGLQPPAAPNPFQGTNCTLGYTASSGSPKTAQDVTFSESDVLVAFSPQTTTLATPGLTINVWYSDEHAMVLGVRQVVVKQQGGTTTTNYPVSTQTANPGVQGNPQVGTTALTGDQAGVDVSSCSGVADSCSRPMWPSLFVTDITATASSRTGDWQFGGVGLPPSAIYGSWKAAVRFIDKTKNPATISVTPDPDPAKNNLNLGTGIPVPSGIQNEGFTSMASWNVAALGLKSGHTYRIQFMVHDGDQTRSGGDVGQNCVNLQVP